MSDKPQTIIGKINVSKIEKERLFRGEKGVYLDIVLIASKNSEYGDDYMILQSVTKEERESGVKGPIIGNAKFMPRKQDAPKTATKAKEENHGEDTVPF